MNIIIHDKITPYYVATIKMLALSSTKCRSCCPFKEIFNFSNYSRLGLDLRYISEKKRTAQQSSKFGVIWHSGF